MAKKSKSPLWPFGLSIDFSLGFKGAYLFQGRLRSAAVRKLTQLLPNPAKEQGIKVDLGPGIPGWNSVTLVGFMSKTLPDIVGHPVEAVAYSRFGGFNGDRRFADFQNPDSPSYQCWYGAYVVFDNGHRRRFGFDADGNVSVQDAIDALEADQRLVYQSAGIGLVFGDGRLVQRSGEFEREIVESNGETWHRLSGEAQTWSTYHRGTLPTESWKFGWCYGSIPSEAEHGVHDLHRLTYRGEFWAHYKPEWKASLCKFFIYPSYDNRQGERIDKGSDWLIEAGQRALAGIRFRRKARRDNMKNI